MLLNKFTEAELRNASRETLESLEYWLRRLIHGILTDAFGGNYLHAMDSRGNRIISRAVGEKIELRFNAEQGRYTRVIDASLLDTLVDIICKPDLYRTYFKPVFDQAFPKGNDEARIFFNRLITPRNHLSHANIISIRQAEQILCYSHDIIDSIKNYYIQHNLNMAFNVPRFIKISDSLGNEKFLQQDTPGSSNIAFQNVEASYLRPGDVLSIEVEVDGSFDPNEYSISWRSTKPIPKFGHTNRISLPIENHHVSEALDIQVVLISNKDWHRMSEGYDDLLIMFYKVLPPV